MEKPLIVNPVFEIPRQDDFAFDQAIRRVLIHEGLFVNDPKDPGGATKYGISLRFAKTLGDLDGDGDLDLDLDQDGDVDENDIRALPIEKVIDIYKRVFWDRYPYKNLHVAVAIKVFDMAVNMGSRQAHKILQRSIRAVSPKDAVAEDGVLGINTINAANRQYAPALVAVMRSEQASFYRHLAAIRPASKKFLKGWLNRAYS